MRESPIEMSIPSQRLIRFQRVNNLPSISSTLNMHVFRTNVILAAFSTYVRKKAAKTTFVRKMCAFNVDEIDT
jgi:hypothetical protein